VFESFLRAPSGNRDGSTVNPGTLYFIRLPRLAPDLHLRSSAPIKYSVPAIMTIHHKLAVWFGSEAVGISDLAVERSEMCVSIPMFGMIESLNLGTSSGIVLYEVAKQRRKYQSRFRLRNHRGERAVPLPTVMLPET